MNLFFNLQSSIIFWHFFVTRKLIMSPDNKWWWHFRAKVILILDYDFLKYKRGEDSNWHHQKKIPPKSSILVLIVSQSGLFVPSCFWLLLHFHIFNKRCWTYLTFAGVPSFKSIIPVPHEFSCLIFAQGEVNMSSCLKPSNIKRELLNLQYYPYFILVPSLDMSIFENALTTFYLTFYFYILILTIWPKLQNWKSVCLYSKQYLGTSFNKWNQI